jgi:Leucine-rich repeat (LRR) protein
LTGLQTLDLSRWKSLTSLQEGISALTGLQTLNLGKCESLTSLPEGISALTRLQTLDLGFCQRLTLLPEGISALTGLQTLNRQTVEEPNLAAGGHLSLDQPSDAGSLKPQQATGSRALATWRISFSRQRRSFRTSRRS